MISLADFVTRNARRDAGGEACIDPATGRRLSHGELERRSRQLAVALRHEVGLEPGDRAAVLARNSAE